MVTSIDLNPEYTRIADLRLGWWVHRSQWGQTDPKTILKYARQEDERQLELFGGEYVVC